MTTLRELESAAKAREERKAVAEGGSRTTSAEILNFFLAEVYPLVEKISEVLRPYGHQVNVTTEDAEHRVVMQFVVDGQLELKNGLVPEIIILGDVPSRTVGMLIPNLRYVDGGLDERHHEHRFLLNYAPQMFSGLVLQFATDLMSE